VEGRKGTENGERKREGGDEMVAPHVGFVDRVLSYYQLMVEQKFLPFPVRTVDLNYWSVAVKLTLWRPLLPYGYGHKASCAIPGWAVICNFWHPGTLTLIAERQECPDVKNYKWRLNPVWYRMLYSCCTHKVTLGVRGLKPVSECIRSKWPT